MSTNSITGAYEQRGSYAPRNHRQQYTTFCPTGQQKLALALLPF